MGMIDPDCESYARAAHAEECERPFADEIGFRSGRVLIKRCHARLRGNGQDMLGVRFSPFDSSPPFADQFCCVAQQGSLNDVVMCGLTHERGARRSGVKIAPIDRLRSDVLATLQPWVRFSASTGARRRERVHLVGCTPSPALSLCRCLPAVKAR